MNKEQIKLLNALSIIKETCIDNVTVCTTCPLYNEEQEICALYNADPCDWDIKEVKEAEFWRAFN